MLTDAIVLTATLTIVGIITYRMRDASQLNTPDPAETDPVVLAVPAEKCGSKGCPWIKGSFCDAEWCPNRKEFDWFSRPDTSCPECNGSGVLPPPGRVKGWELADEAPDRWRDCLPCDGTGLALVRAKKRHPSSRIPKQRGN
jgi:hypothetical protein